MTVSVIIAVLLLVFAVGTAVVAFAAQRKKLPGNRFIGVRTTETRADQRTWNAAHSAAAPLWWASAFGWLLAGIVATQASGWAWLLVIILSVAALMALGAGAAAGAATAAKVHQIIGLEQEATSGCCSAGGTTAEASESCGSDCGCDDAAAHPAQSSCTPPAAAEDPSVDCGVTGGCGTCDLHGMCTNDVATPKH